MTFPPTSRDIQRWYPERWDQVAGNSGIVRTWRDCIDHGGCNMLFTGPSRSGKTRAISLGVKALMCPRRTASRDPCGECPSCRSVDEARHGHTGLFSAVTGSEYSFIPIDCQSVSADELRRQIADTALEDVRTIVYLDEVAALGQRGLESMLLKPIDESPCLWVASAITVNKPSLWGKTKRTPGLSNPMQGRFAIKVGTSLPRDEELRNWIVDRCREWQIELVDPQRTLPRIVKRTGHRVGYVIHLLAAAALRGRRIAVDDVEGFNFRAEE